MWCAGPADGTLEAGGLGELQLEGVSTQAPEGGPAALLWPGCLRLLAVDPAHALMGRELLGLLRVRGEEGAAGLPRPP